MYLGQLSTFHADECRPGRFLMLKKVILALAVLGLFGMSVETASAHGWGHGSSCYGPYYGGYGGGFYRPYYGVGYGGYAGYSPYAFRGPSPYFGRPYGYPGFGGYGYGRGFGVSFGF
jgi:hypothetical protein